MLIAGQVLSRENIEAVIKFAHEENLFLMADEVHTDILLFPFSYVCPLLS